MLHIHFLWQSKPNVTDEGAAKEETATTTLGNFAFSLAIFNYFSEPLSNFFYFFLQNGN